jgi:predicted O-methyltransferase YrrM
MVEWNQHFTNIADILRNVGERVEGNLVCDVSPDNIVMGANKEKIHNIQHLVKGKTRICEIGVNAGHSLLFMLEQNPTAEYFLFDLGNHGYTGPCLDYIRTQYPNTKIHIVYGDSKQTIPNFIMNNKDYINTFDFVHIDGGHGILEVTSDFYNCRYLSSKDGVTIFDDYNYNTIKEFINDKVSVDMIKQYHDTLLQQTDKQFIYTF